MTATKADSPGAAPEPQSKELQRAEIELREHAARAEAPLFWPVRLQCAVGGVGRVGPVLMLVVLAILLATEHPGGLGAVLANPNTTAIGEALFFAVTLALLLEFAGLIPRAAQRDLDSLENELTLDAAEQGRLRAALICRLDGKSTLLFAGIGAGLGLIHAWYGGGLGNDSGLVNGFAVATVILWLLMFQTGAVLVTNAQLFAALGAQATMVEPFAPQRLYPFVQAALRPMLLITSLLAAYPLTLLTTPVWSGSTLIGPVATLALALAAVWLPLRGLAGRMRLARDQALARIDAEISLVWGELERNTASADRLEALLALRDRLGQAPLLPLAIPGLWRALLYLALPLATWSGKGIAEAVLNQMLGTAF